MQTDRLGDFVGLFVGDVVQLFAVGGELLVDLDGLLGHDLVGFLRAAGQDEVGAGGEPLVAIGIEANAVHALGAVSC